VNSQDFVFMDYREKIITENLNFCKENIEVLNDWEKGFINSLNPEWKLSQNQFNKLSDITLQVSQRKFKNL